MKVALKVAIAGSSGLVGSGLVPALQADGHEVIRLVRGAAVARDEVAWHPSEGVLDPADLAGVDAVINLAGAGVGDKKWTPERKRELIDSRVQGTHLLATTMAALDPRPTVFLSGSAIGVYGAEVGGPEHDEASAAGTGFLADLVVAWEAAAQPAVDAGIRTVFLRTGIVQSTAGGALAKQLLPFKLGLGGRLGSGRQTVSWISLADEVAAIKQCLTDATLSGPVNLTSPSPVTNREYTKALGAAVHRPTLVPIPTPALRVLFGSEMVEEMFLGGEPVRPSKLLAAGFTWRHPTLESAFDDIL